jgi:DNA polymerase III subunit delta'
MLFREVIGQDEIKKRLIDNATNNRISHAQLFWGQQGSGTLALTLAYARFIQCRNRQADDACGQCPSCLKFNKLEHPDIHFIFPAAPIKGTKEKEKVSSKMFITQWRNYLLKSPYFNYLEWLEALGIENKQAIINAEDCNDIIRTLGLKSYESPYKIVIIYMIEKLYYAAAPKLLKIVEEPPDNTLFLMVSENKDRIINTIVSRTQQLKVPLPPENEIRQALIERYGLDEAKAGQIAFLSDGDIARALKLIDDEEEMADFNAFREWMRYCYLNDTAKILKWVEKTAAAGREKQKSFFQFGLKMFRLSLINNYMAADLIRLDKEQQKFLDGFSPFINHHNALKIVDSFNEAILHLERNANSRILFADLSFRLSKLMHIKTS